LIKQGTFLSTDQVVHLNLLEGITERAEEKGDKVERLAAQNRWNHAYSAAMLHVGDNLDALKQLKGSTNPPNQKARIALDDRIARVTKSLAEKTVRVPARTRPVATTTPATA
jgi:hypothetical protein